MLSVGCFQSVLIQPCVKAFESFCDENGEAKHDYDSVTHVDGTARVQVVKPDCESILRPILEEWYEQTGCPMLLNTSLNIKGQPMVDTIAHANEFENKYKVKVF